MRLLCGEGYEAAAEVADDQSSVAIWPAPLELMNLVQSQVVADNGEQ